MQRDTAVWAFQTEKKRELFQGGHVGDVHAATPPQKASVATSGHKRLSIRYTHISNTSSVQLSIMQVYEENNKKRHTNTTQGAHLGWKCKVLLTVPPGNSLLVYNRPHAT